MPYIKKEDRKKFTLKSSEIPNNSGIDLIEYLGELIGNSGQFNYVVTKLAHKYLEVEGNDYQHMNDLIGALEGIKLELYRRKIAPYEDLKISENGDV